MKPKLQVRSSFTTRLSRWLAGVALAVSMATPALAAQVQGPAQVTDLNPDVVITILDTVDGLLSLLEDGPNNISCRAECTRQCKAVGDIAVANCKTDFQCDNNNAPSGTVVESQFRAGYYRCDNIKRQYDLDNFIPEESLY